MSQIIVPASDGDTKEVFKDVRGDATEVRAIEEKYADITLRFVERYGETVTPLTPESEKKLSRKLRLHIMTLVCVINLVLFVSHPFLSGDENEGRS